jgi:hypothetical protein
VLRLAQAVEEEGEVVVVVQLLNLHLQEEYKNTNFIQPSDIQSCTRNLNYAMVTSD